MERPEDTVDRWRQIIDCTGRKRTYGDKVKDRQTDRPTRKQFTKETNSKEKGKEIGICLDR